MAKQQKTAKTAKTTKTAKTASDGNWPVSRQIHTAAHSERTSTAYSRNKRNSETPSCVTRGKRKTANRQFAKSCALHAQQDPRFSKWAIGHRPNRNSVFHSKTLAVWWAYSGHWPNHKTGTLSSIGHQPPKCIAQNQDPCFYSGRTKAIGQTRPLPFGGHSTNFTSHFGNKPDRNLVFHSGH